MLWTALTKDLDNGWNSERNKLTDKNDAFQRSELNEVNEVNK